MGGRWRRRREDKNDSRVSSKMRIRRKRGSRCLGKLGKWRGRRDSLNNMKNNQTNNMYCYTTPFLHYIVSILICQFQSISDIRNSSYKSKGHQDQPILLPCIEDRKLQLNRICKSGYIEDKRKRKRRGRKMEENNLPGT